MSVIGNSEAFLPQIERYVARVTEGSSEANAYLLDESQVKYGPCVTRPGKIICVGLNYRKHAEETNAPIPQYPILFNKFNNTIAAQGDEIPASESCNESGGL